MFYVGWAFVGLMLGVCWAHVGSMLGRVGPILGHLGPMLRPCWAYIGPVWAMLRHVGSNWAHFGSMFGPMLGPCWVYVSAHVGPMLGHVEPKFGNLAYYPGKRSQTVCSEDAKGKGGKDLKSPVTAS